ncbi:anti sigma factor C-terminal domain-containing protein [Paenibacillus sp. EC2-1]|uniref:anti sigma factor C-terminal domain-containing protein n=1 Tax=Paenibacillus sp. EC2-1 TaxID=3388665 RepID=UPI003BEEC0ED
MKDDLKERAPDIRWRTGVRVLTNVSGAIVLLFLVYSLYIAAINMYLDTTGMKGKFIRSVISVAELLEDGMRVDKGPFPTVEVTPFITQKTTLKLYRDVGKWQVVTGEIRAERTVTGQFSYSIVDLPTYLNTQRQAAFSLPYTIMFNKPMEVTPRPEHSLKQLSKIADGNVARLSFSVSTLMSPDQLMEKLASYDVFVTELPVYAGELKEFNTSFSKSEADYYVPHLSLRPLNHFDENNQLSSSAMYFTPEDKGAMSEHVSYMMSDLEWMTTHIKYNGVDIDKKRLAYLKKHGVQVYGATVTGPVRELEKLQEQPEFRDFRLGLIEVWNWE